MDPKEKTIATTASLVSTDQEEAMRQMLKETDKGRVLQAMRDLGWTLQDIIKDWDLAAIQEVIRESLAQGEASRANLKEETVLVGSAVAEATGGREPQSQVDSAFFGQTERFFESPDFRSRLDALYALSTQIIKAEKSMRKTNFTPINKDKKLKQLQELGFEIEPFEQRGWAELQDVLSAFFKEKMLEALRAEGFETKPGFEALDTEETLKVVERFLFSAKLAAIAVAAEQAQVDSTHEQGPTTLEGLVPELHKRMVDALESPATRSTPDVAPEDPVLADLKADFDRGLFILEEKKVTPEPSEGAGRFLAASRQKQLDRSALTWEQVVDRLNQPHRLNPKKTGMELALAMQGKGELIGVDKEGHLLIKDRGQEPSLCNGMDYWESYEAVYGSEGEPTGYELFPTGDLYGKPEQISALEKLRKARFLEGEQDCSTWLDNGRDPEKRLTAVKTLDFSKAEEHTFVTTSGSSERKKTRGAVRLLKV